MTRGIYIESIQQTNDYHSMNENRYILVVRERLVRLRGPVMEANKRLIFEDDLRSGGLQGFTTQ